MLISVLKQILWRRPVLDDGLAKPAFAPYYNEGMLTSRMRRKSESLREAYLHYPALVHIETQALCNAACNFCPYPGLERKGARMSDELIDKIVGDLAEIPRDLPFQLAPYKVSEPFVEKRLFAIMRSVNERLPNARISMPNGVTTT